jgi:HK97 family phage portal protein
MGILDIFRKNKQNPKTSIEWKSFYFPTEYWVSNNFRAYYNMYRFNSDLRRCVEEMQQNAIKDGYELLRWDDVVEDQKIDDALNFVKPFGLFKNQVIQHLVVANNAFIEYVKNPMGTIIWYKVLDPRTIAIVADNQWNVQKYIQNINQQIIEFEPDEIEHFTDNLDPDNELWGMSLLESILDDVFSDREASKSNYFFFKNNAVPSQLYVLNDWLNHDEIKIAVDQIKKQFSWGKNRHKATVSPNIKDIKNLSQTHKDMEFLNQRKFTTERVCALMWVPKIVLNYTDGVNYSNAEVQYKKFIENTIRPLETELEGYFTTLIQRINPDIEFNVIDNHINDFADKTNQSISLVTQWVISRNEWRQLLWLDVSEDPEMDEITVPSSTVTLLNVTENDPEEEQRSINTVKSLLCHKNT